MINLFYINLNFKEWHKSNLNTLDRKMDTNDQNDRPT